MRHCYFQNSISAKEKDEINYMFSQADIKFNCLSKLFTSNLKQETKEIRDELKDSYFAYWKITTGADIMSSKYNVITADFLHKHNEAYGNFETQIKKTINQIHRI